jgi:hypothetical protein
LREHEATKLSAGKRPLLVKYHALEVFPKCEPPLLEGAEVQPMALLHLGPVELELRRRSFARMVIPSVAEQHATDIQE